MTAFALALMLAGRVGAEGASWRGLSLEQALRRLQQQGLALVFTSEVVRPELAVTAEPASAEPRAILDELLAPHGLTVLERGGDQLVVVPVAAVQRASIRGWVRARDTRLPIAGARVRIDAIDRHATTDVNGRFELSTLPSGEHSITAESEDYLPEIDLRVRAGENTEIEIALTPIPFLREEIVVRSSQLSMLEDEPIAPLALSRTEMQELPHLSEDVFRAVSLLPGVTSNDVSAQFNIHGGRRDEVRILLDGQELYEAFHLQEFDRALSIVPASGLAGASLSTGAFAAEHGDRMSGVLDLTSAEPSSDHRTRLALGLLSLSASSGGHFGDERASWFLSARRGSIDLANRLLGREDPSFWDGFAKAATRASETSQWRASVLLADDQLEFAAVDGTDTKSYRTRHQSAYFWMNHDAMLGDRVLVESRASWSRFERDRLGIENEEDQNFDVVDRRDFDVLEAGQSWSFDLGADHTLEAGFQGRRYDVTYDYSNRFAREFALSFGTLEPVERTTRFAGRLSSDHLGLYASDRVSLGSSLTAELGLRYDRHSLTDDTLLSPRANLAWRTSELSVVRLGWGHYFQSQRPYELAIEDGADRFLSAERSEHWVLGYERLISTDERAPLRALRVELYRRDVRDPRPRFENLLEPLNTFPEVEQDRVRIVPTHSRAQGLELLLRGALGARGDWWLNYSRSTASDEVGGETLRRPTDQPHALNANVAWRFGPHWSLDLAWRYHTGWPTTPVSLIFVEDDEGELEPVAVAGRPRSKRLPAYHRLDVRASRGWQRGSHRFTFFVDVQNLYDRQNLAGFDLGIDDDGEAPRLDLAAEAWPGIFPSAGFSWEF